MNPDSNPDKGSALASFQVLIQLSGDKWCGVVKWGFGVSRGRSCYCPCMAGIQLPQSIQGAKIHIAIRQGYATSTCASM